MLPVTTTVPATGITPAAEERPATEATRAAEEVVAVLGALRRVTRRKLRAAIPGPRLRGAQLELLQLVEREPGIGVAAAARALHLAGNSVSTLANQLVNEGFLVREVDPADRRAARLRLTEQAEARLADWRTARAALVETALRRLPDADQRALAAAVPVFRRLLAELEGSP
jgi:DNA-binding MarR family transcriptional regulator